MSGKKGKSTQHVIHIMSGVGFGKNLATELGRKETQQKFRNTH